MSPRQPSGKNIIRWLLKKRTNGSVRYCQYTSPGCSIFAGWLAGVFLTIAGMIISFMWGLDGKHIALEAHTFDSVKFILTTA
ncbi:hypothetical protein F7F07_30230, partial [Escherichia coli]